MCEPYRLSVVIPTYQRCSSLERTLHALARQTLLATEYEVIVSIDGSQDGTQEMVERFSAPYLLRAAWRPNAGRAAACNTGIRAATGELVLIMDDDIEPAPECLAAHVESQSRDARLGIMGAVPVTLDASSSRVAEYMQAKFEHHLARLAQAGYELQLRDFSTQNFSIRRHVLLEVGAFDETLFRIYGNEDLEMSVRLKSAGVRLVYNPSALARQYYTKDFATTARDNIAKGRTAVLFAGKHPQTFQELKLSQYRLVSRKWRLIRALLLTMSKARAPVPDVVVTFTRLLEQVCLVPLHRYYLWALDYFFWLGAEAQLHEGMEGTWMKSALAA